MNTTENYFDEHAELRLAQRNLTAADVNNVLRFGREIHRAGATFFFLGRKDLPAGREKELEKLVGATIVMNEWQVKTAYRNRRAIGKIKRKGKYKQFKFSWRKRRLPKSKI